MTEQRIAEAQARLDSVADRPTEEGYFTLLRRGDPAMYEVYAHARYDLSQALAALRRVRDVLKNRSRIIVVFHPDDAEVVNVSDVLAALDGEGE